MSKSKHNDKKNNSKPLINPKHKNLIYTLGFLGVFLLFFVINNSSSEPEQGPYPPGYKPYVPAAMNGTAPSFELLTIEGKKINLNDYKGKVVLLDFWATWCPPCRRGIPDLVDLKNKYSDKDFEIIGISVDQENTIDQINPFIKNYNINYPVVLANNQVVMSYGGIESIPTSFLINKDGKIVSKHVGLIAKEQYINEIEAAL